MTESSPAPIRGLEEVKILQNIIARHENYCFQVKGWYAAILGGLAVALYSVHILISGLEFFVIGSVVWVSFVVWLLYHRAIIRRAIGRVELLEEGSGTKIVESLSRELTWPEWVTAGRDHQVSLPILVGAVVLFVLYVFAPSATSPPTPSPIASDTGGVTDEVSKTSPIPPPTVSDAGGAIPDPLPSVTVILVMGFLVIGAALMLLGHGAGTKSMGAIALASGLFSGLQFVAVKELKIDSLLKAKFEIPGNSPSAPQDNRFLGTQIHVDHVEFVHNSSEPRPVNGFGAEWLGSIENFRIGRASIDLDGFEAAPDLKKAKDALDNICADWKRRADTDNALVLVVGATDRLPLAGAVRARYDANTGLALARAAAARDYCWTKEGIRPDPKNVVLLVSGPRNTPEIERGQARAAPVGFPQDRRVDVWALVSVPASGIVEESHHEAGTATNASEAAEPSGGSSGKH